MTLTEDRYLELVLDDPSCPVELVDGVPREKPPMTWEHGHTFRLLSHVLYAQLDPSEYEVVINSGRVRRSARNYFVPDVYVAPMEYVRRTFTEPGAVEVYREPLPLVVEVWSRSTGRYDVTAKANEYKRRGDQEIWLIHPYERTLTAWRLQPDGSYAETVYRGGTVQPVALPGVAVNLDTLFE